MGKAALGKRVIIPNTFQNSICCYLLTSYILLQDAIAVWKAVILRWCNAQYPLLAPE